ncbi:MAG: DNA methyltransferase [Candidatus Heimdallarchaeota archaeon]
MSEKILKPYQRDFGERGVYDTRNPLNVLTGKEWTFSTKTVLPKSYPPSFSHKVRNQHGGQKPPELAQELIETFTKPGELIMDPLAGVGGSLVGTTLAGSNRRAIGIEINPKWKAIYEQVCRENKVEMQELIVGDARQLVDELIEDESVDFILTDVPYGPMDRLKKTRGVFSRAGESKSNKKKLKSSLHQFDDDSEKAKLTKLTQEHIDIWLQDMKRIFQICFPKLKKGKYMAVFIGNMYRNLFVEKRKRGRYLMLSALLATLLEDLGWILKAERIWYDPGKSLGIYGYPYVYIPSVVDIRILILRKE